MSLLAMNILIATGIYPPEAGGPATYSYELAHALQARGHHVTVIAYGEEEEIKKTSTKKGTDIIEVKWISRRGGIVVRYARYASAMYALKGKIDVIFAQGAVSEGVPATLMSKIMDVPLVMRIPGDYAWEMGMQLDPTNTEESLDRFLTHTHAGRVRVYERLERWTAHQAFSMVVPSQYLRSVVERWGIPSERIHVIKNAVQPLPMPASRAALRKQWHLQNAVVCLTAARAVRWKGVQDLISWWHRIPVSHVLVVAGDGPELDAWKKVAKSEGVEDRIYFLGRVDRATLTSWYDAADVFVLHTGYEGYPHTVPEAVSRGLPCLVSDQGGNPEAASDFVDMVTVIPYQDRDQWTDALSNSQMRTSLGARPLTWTHAQMTEVVEQQLREVLQPGENQEHVVMVGYERDLLRTESDAFQRVARLAEEAVTLSAFVVAHLPEDVAVERDGLRVQGFCGSSIRRIARTIHEGVRRARRLPGRTVISGQDPFAAGFIAYCISRITNQPLELQEHGDFWSGAWKKERISHRVWAWVGIWLMRRAENIRVVSERVKTHLIAQGIPSERIVVIPVAQDLTSFLSLPLPVQKREGWILRVPCRFVPQKGLDVLLKAFARIRERHLNTRLELVGGGPLQGWLEAEIRRQNLSQAVEIRAWMPAEEVWEGADVFIMSSRYEGFGRTITEAMAAGVSVVATDVGCIGSYAQHERDVLVASGGRAADLADVVNRLLEDDELRERLRRSARETVQTLPLSQALCEKQHTHWRSALKQQKTWLVGPRFELWVVSFIIFAILTRTTSVILFHQQLLSREWGFFTIVQNWFQGYGYSFAPTLGCATAYRSPGYLFFLTALYSVFDPANTWAQAIIQNIFVVGALWLTYIVGKRLVGPKAALAGGFIMACYPYTFYHYTQFYHTFLQSFFLLLVVWCVLRLGETRRLMYAVASGLAIGALAYVQGTILPVTPFIAVWVIWRLWSDKKRAVGAVLLMALFSAGLIAPWTYRNWKVFHQFIPLTTDVGHALIKANNENIYELTKRGYPQEIIEDVPSSTNPFYKQYRLPESVEAELKQAGVFHESILWTEWHPKEPVLGLKQCSDRGTLDEYAFNQYWIGKTKQQWRDYWGWEVWRLPLQKITTFWRPGLFPSIKTGAAWSFAGNAWKEWAARTSVFVSTGFVILLGLIGWGMQVKKKQPNAWLVGSFFLVFTLMHAIVAGYTKYRIPLDHLLAPYAAYVVMVALQRLRRAKKNSL